MNILNKSVIPFVAIILGLTCCFSSSLPATDTPWLFSPLPTGNTIMEVASDAYSQRSSVYGAESLPLELKKIFLQNDLSEIDQLATVLRTNLLFNFSEINELLLFFDNDPAIVTDYYRDRIAELADIARIYRLLINDYYDFIDKYDDDISWYSRFGANGVFEKIRLYQQELFIFQAAWVYYCKSLDCPFDSVFPGSNKDLISKLETLFEQDGHFEYLLWLIRLSEEFDDDFDIQLFDASIFKQLNSSISYERALELSLIKLEIQYRTGAITSGKALEEVNRLIANFGSIPESISSASVNIFLRVILFESVLCGNYATSGSIQSAKDSASLTSGNCYIGLLAKAGKYPDIADRVESLVAIRVSALLKDTPVDSWGEYLAKWDNSVLLAVGKAMQYASEPDFRGALIIYDIIARTELFNQREYAQMLYFRSLSRISQKPVSVSEQLAAVNDLALLLTRCNNQPANIPSRSQQFELIISLARDYCSFEKADLVLLIEVLKPIVQNHQGRFELGGGGYVPEDFFFFYGSLLEKQELYIEAARFFSMVKELPLARFAIFHRCYCLFRDGNITSDRREYYEQVVQPLRELITLKNELDTIDIQSAELLSIIGTDSQWDELFYDRVMPVLEKVESEKARFLVKSSIGFLNSQIEILRRLAAKGSDSDFILIHERILKLAVIVLEKAIDTEKVRASEVFSEIASYRLSYFAGSEQLDPELKKIGPLLDKVTAFLTSDSVASVRANAFASVANKQYDKSRNYWYRIRSATSEQGGYLFWEARFWGIYCLILDNQPKEAIHAIEVLEAETGENTIAENIWCSLWLDRIKNLKYNSSIEN